MLLVDIILKEKKWMTSSALAQWCFLLNAYMQMFSMYYIYHEADRIVIN